MEASWTRDSKRRRKTRNGDEKAALKEDRISGLPNSLLLHILSFLPTQDAATTSVLSKKWQYLWTSVPILDFRYYQMTNTNLNSFASCIYRSLLLNRSPNIEKFRVHMHYKKALASDVDVWLRFLTGKNVEELDLYFSTEVHPNFDCSTDEDDDDDNDNGGSDDGDENINRYHLPMIMFSNISSLTCLKLRNCEICHGRQINWKSLTVLSLSEMSLNDGIMSEMLCGCPSLELLELFNCRSCHVVYIKSEGLRKLVVSHCEISPLEDDAFTTIISAPNLQSLDISGYFYEYFVINSPSLAEAKLNFYPSSSSDLDRNHDKYTKIFAELLENICHVKDVTLGNWCLQVLSMLEEKGLPCTLSSWLCLRLDTYLDIKELPGITRLLGHSPLIETLVINMISVNFNLPLETENLESYDLGEENYWLSQKSSFTLALQNLKTVRIVRFLATKSEVELLLFLLKIANMLEKMIVHPRNRARVSLKNCVDVTQTLLSFPRCSPNAVVLFS